MRTRRLELMLSVCALLLAAAALVVGMQSGALAAGASTTQQAAAPVIPATVNYQGILRNANGSLVSGTFKITARIYTLPTAGTLLYQESFDNVTVRDGLFNIVLGDNPSTPLADALSDSPRYIAIAVGNDPEQSPRQRIHAVPWALFANTAVSATTAITATTALSATNAFSATDAINAQNAVNAQNAANAQNAVNAQNAANAQLATRLFVDSANDIERVSDAAVDGWRFWANDGFVWIGANQNLMSLSPTKGSSINTGLNVNGRFTVNDTPPVRIMRFTSYQLTDNTTTRVPTGIASTDYYCSFGGWDAAYDVQETGTGTWSRYLYTNNGLWEVKFFNNVQNSPLIVSFDIVCYLQGFYELVGPPAAAAAAGAVTNDALPALTDE
ncbi:hypothetical protein [Caldilinea sp.]|uniref:hypothetical protein n=1 Tax=Caldilinea sp. TaxID=2293560 RepID=UPI002CBB7174|nr:hypothetical protein [Anaerolineales bacterium]HQY90227.1 hypothetical protein [Caldilinea sp.]HRA68544.1 hypothetical protein [Caldilinea sp.]